MRVQINSCRQLAPVEQLLKYAPMKSEFQKAISMDETIKTELSIDMSEVSNREVIDGEFTEQAAQPILRSFMA